MTNEAKDKNTNPTGASAPVVQPPTNPDGTIDPEAVADNGAIDMDQIEPRGMFAPAPGMAGVPGAGMIQNATLIVQTRDIFKFRGNPEMLPATLRAASVTADAAGDKIVAEGTVLQKHASGLYEPCTGGTGSLAVAVLPSRVNLRDGDVDAGIVKGNATLTESKCWDNAVFGTVRAGSKTALAVFNIRFG